MASLKTISGTQERWLRVLANAIEGGIVFVDEQGVPEYVSDKARDLLTCADESDCAEIWAPIHERIFSAPSGSTGSVLERTVDVNAEVGGRNLDLRIEITRHSSEDCGYVAVVRSRRQLRRLESELRLSDRMRGIMALYRTMVHDLKAPLNVIVISLDSLHKSLTEDGSVDEERRAQQLASVRTLQSELVRLQRSLQAYLDHTGAEQTEQATFDFRRAVREVMALVRPGAEHQGVRIETRITEQQANVFGARDQLKQVIFNLAMNALEAMPDGGTLTVELEVDAEAVHLTLRDDGRGIPPEIIEQVFEMHVTTKEEGSGIGLFVARGTIAEHGGAIRLQSEPGTGTTAEIELPLVRDDMPEGAG